MRKVKKRPAAFSGPHLREAYASLNSISALTGHNRGKVIMDWVALMFWAMQHNDESYLRILADYSVTGDQPRPADLFARAMGALMAHMAITNVECLGDIFVEFCGEGSFGQFFTPAHVCAMMSNMTVRDVPDGRVFTICDPCAGAGGMLVAAMRRLTPEQGDRAFFVAQDLDFHCCMLTALNMTFFNMHGLIAHGDSLAVEVRSAWETVRTPLGGILRPFDAARALEIIEGALGKGKAA